MKVIAVFFITLIITVSIFQYQGCYYVKTAPGILKADFPSLSETQTELFFGLSKPDGSSVTENEWNKFVDDYISPELPEGFTIVDARGQWTNTDNKIIKENSKLLVVIYKYNKEIDSSLSYVINNYKRIFHQSSVLRVTFPVGVAE
jgi:hypothetical protein